MEGGYQVHCLICGNESSSHYNATGEYSSALVQNYVKILGHYFQEQVKYEVEEGEKVMACKNCIFYLTSVVNGMERIEELNKNVAELEQNLWRKLLELKSEGDNVMSQLKLIKNSMMDRQNEDQKLNQNEIYLRKGTEKACTRLAGPMSELEEKLDWFKKWEDANANTGKIKIEVESASSAPAETCRIVSVTSMATSADDKSFEAGQVFQVKTEQEDDADAASNGEPVLEGVVKIEKEFVRKTRQGNVHRTKEVSLSFGNVDIVRTTENEKSAGEPMLIDLEEDETKSTDARNVSLSSPFHDNHLEKTSRRNKVDETESSEELNLEVEEEDEIPGVNPDDDDDNVSALSSNKKQIPITSNDEETKEDEAETSSIANRPGSTPPHPSSSSGSAAVAISKGKIRQSRSPEKKSTCYYKRSGKFHCRQCDKSDESLSNILYHYESVHRSFKCDICNVAGYTTSGNLILHKKTCQQKLENRKSKEKNPKFKFVCEVCGERFETNRKLKGHKYFKHEFVRSYSCDFCNRKFKTTLNLQKHKNKDHFRK